VEANSTGGQGCRRAVAPSDDELIFKRVFVNFFWAGGRGRKRMYSLEANLVCSSHVGYPCFSDLSYSLNRR
jgi:hypothetical protein